MMVDFQDGLISRVFLERFFFGAVFFLQNKSRALVESFSHVFGILNF